MDVILSWMQELLTGKLPSEALTTLFGIGSVVAVVVGCLRRRVVIKSKSTVIVAVVIVSAVINALVFGIYHIFTRANAMAYIMSTLLSTGSAIFQHQAVKELVAPTVKAASVRVQATIQSFTK